MNKKLEEEEEENEKKNDKLNESYENIDSSNVDWTEIKKHIVHLKLEYLNIFLGCNINCISNLKSNK